MTRARRRSTTILGGALAFAMLGTPPPANAQASDPPVELVLNVPESRIDVYEHGEHRARYRVSVGMDGYETPPGRYRVTHAVWNPWWHPPDSEWARGRKPEAPGPRNPMGRVKLHFSHLLYIHGTPELAWLGRPASRGCVRMANEDLIELAKYLHRKASPRVPASTIEALIADADRTRRIDLARPVPFRVVYHIAEVRDGNLHIYPDVYGKVGAAFEEEVRAVLREHGVDLDDVDRAKLERLLKKGRTRKVSMALETLTSSEAAGSGGSAR